MKRELRKLIDNEDSTNQSNSYSDYDDEHLLYLIKAQDHQALAEVVNRYGRLAYSLALRILGDQGWAEEVFQDVLVKLWQKPDMYNPKRGDFRRWLLSVTHNAAIDNLRGRHGSEQKYEVGFEKFDILPDGYEDPSEDVARKLQAEEVRGALALIPREQKEVIELAYYGGMTISQIARLTGASTGTIKTRMRLGMMKLRQILTSSGASE